MKKLIIMFFALCSTFISFGSTKNEIEINYSLDSLLVTLTHEESMLFKEYTAEDFGIEEYGMVECINKTFAEVTEGIINNSLNLKTEEQIKFFGNININNYYKILRINLFEPDLDKLEYVEEIVRNNPMVECVEKDYFINILSSDYRKNDEEKDTRTPTQDIYESMDIDGARSAYNSNQNTVPVNVAILDTGVMSSHEDFNYVDSNNPSNSYCVVDVQNSYDFMNDCGYSTTITDPLNHGTGIAGIIAAIQNNGVGIDGICNKANIISYRVHQQDSACALTSRTISAIDKALLFSENNPYPIQVFNCSFSCLNSTSLENSMRYYPGLFVCAAGNEYKDISLDQNYVYPACIDIPNVLCVGALDSGCHLWYISGQQSNPEGSNYGSTVDVYALGKNAYTLSNTSSSSYGYFNGTSFACPYVTGAAALLISMGYDAYEAKQTLLNALCGNSVEPEHRIINVYSWSNPNHVHTHHPSHDTSITDLITRHTTAVCNTCGLYLYLYNQTEVSHTSTMHTFHCEGCNENYNCAHVIQYLDLGVDVGHKRYCQQCSYYAIQNHLWINNGFYYVCSICGTETAFLPIIHD